MPECRILKAEAAARRLDRWLAQELPEFSRSQIEKFCAAGKVSVDGKTVRASHSLRGGERVELLLEREERDDLAPEKIPLDILYEDSELLVVNKARGMVVHPAPGHHGGTLVNAILAHCRNELSSLGGKSRPGIVHRIDKDTSGLLLVCKNDKMHRLLADMISRHEVSRDYIALVWGHPKSRQGTIEAPIGRDPKNRQRMTVLAGGRPAISHFELVESFARSSELSLSLETGRTHQLRVHLRYINLPIIGDPLYAGQRENFGFRGQALHAWRLRFRDPRSGEERVFTAAPPPEYMALRECLRAE